MAVSDHTSHDKPVRAEPVAEPDPPRRQEREDAGTDNEKPVTPYSSEDGHDANIEAEVDQGQEQPRVLAPEKSADCPPLSRHTSSFAYTNTVVPRAERRGLLGRFAIIPEIEQPHEYKNSTKWMITLIVSLAAAGAPMGSGIILREFTLLGGSRLMADSNLAALPSMTVDLGVTETVANMTISFYMLAMSIFPLWWYVSSRYLRLGL